jgi:lipopolysaccharide transport system permease protein
VLSRNRELIWEMARRDFAERYLGQGFGTAWQILHPLTFIAIYIVIFSVVFKAKAAVAAGGQTHYVSYLLSGLLPWMLFQEVMGKAPSAILSNSNLVKQVVFPIEILPVKTVLASLVSHLPYMVLSLLYIGFLGSGLTLTALLLPVLLFVQAIAMIGVAYVLSAITVYVRDVRELVQLFARLGIYLAPVVYVGDQAPPLVRWLLLANPFSHLIWCYQDATYYGAIQHPISWIVFPVLSLIVVLVGHRIFEKLKPYFGSVL